MCVFGCVCYSVHVRIRGQLSGVSYPLGGEQRLSGLAAGVSAFVQYLSTDLIWGLLSVIQEWID